MGIPMNGKKGQGLSALIDDEDFDFVSEYRWYVNAYGYAVCNHYIGGRISKGYYGQEVIFMHRLIMDAPKGVEVDHKDANRLNNCRVNLRLCNKSQNQANSKIRKDNTSGYKGVSWHKQVSKWHANIMLGGKSKSLGLFDTKEQAAQAYREASLEYHKEFTKC